MSSAAGVGVGSRRCRASGTYGTSRGNNEEGDGGARAANFFQDGKHVGLTHVFVPF
jgi:hypothetical protein